MRYIALLMLLVTVPALAVDSEPTLPNAALQQRYETLTHEFRCLVCQNETIAESGAGLAADLRAQVREQLIAGKSDEQIKQYMVARYGDFVLFKPPWQPNTWLLWGGPLLLLCIGAIVVITVVRRKSQLLKTLPGDVNGDDLKP
ncbi:MAG TPA: cytochrome c-type biogenesis protein [Gammaproteobacteria bacterium]|nr:cytochrome c-type biogenesis protein [Gammaproteobacteria bacterium]